MCSWGFWELIHHMYRVILWIQNRITLSGHLTLVVVSMCVMLIGSKPVVGLSAVGSALWDHHRTGIPLSFCHVVGSVVP